jgi:hypothetical protein
MSWYKFLGFFCSCILVLRLYIDECTHHTHNFGQPVFDFVSKLHKNYIRQLYYN